MTNRLKVNFQSFKSFVGCSFCYFGALCASRKRAMVPPQVNTVSSVATVALVCNVDSGSTVSAELLAQPSPPRGKFGNNRSALIQSSTF